MPEIINKILENESFCGSILIAKGQEIIYERGFGLADQSTFLPNSTDIIYRIGSLAKQFTALCILRLIEGGVLDLNDPIYKYIPSQTLFKNITIHQLLVHSSGLPVNFPYDIHVDSNDTDLIEALKTVDVNESKSHIPEYSNVGYSILGHLIEVGSGYTYSEYISKQICEPLGLLNSGADFIKYSEFNNRAYGYELGEKSKLMQFRTYEGAGSSFYTTAKEYRKWDLALYSDNLISEKYKILMFKCYEPITSDIGYGYGWEVNRLYPTIHQHSGYVAGISSFVMRNIDTKFLLFAVSNSGEEGLKPIQTITDKINNGFCK
ncbi:beta-lactamase family protein [Paenibacillus sp. PR3]|uniref:Beta-lactamase family protein n=1 Tax=Paenibacillus terricola TaxID=2763503 RepID=A0ABR8MV58_9BACL|nr:serine hydrolase domain-containing protein [Paenibacillus terricola]MBD3919854.1 beta-lactamase family protein [Paenibacillus terricola]